MSLMIKDAYIVLHLGIGNRSIWLIW